MKHRLDTREFNLDSRERSVSTKEKYLSAEINKESERKVREEIQYNKQLLDKRISEADARFSKEKKLWHLKHDGSYIVFLVFMIVYTSVSAVLWNDGYADNIKEIIHIIVKGAVIAVLGIWRGARYAGSFAERISNETAAMIVQILLTVSVLAGVTAAGFIVLRKLIKKLIKHWKKTNMWDMTSLVTAAVLFGISALLPASMLNWSGIGILIYAAYISVRSFIQKNARIKRYV